MSITGELREWKGRIQICLAPEAVLALRGELNAIADRIDDAALGERNAAYNEGYDEGFASADDWLADHEDAMAEHGWVRLPKDADGVPIHVGDTLDGYGKTIEVVEMRNGRGGWVLISRDGNGYADTFAFAHHHEPTVEDVLMDLLEESSDPTCDATPTELAEKYAAKLRLAESEDA